MLAETAVSTMRSMLFRLSAMKIIVNRFENIAVVLLNYLLLCKAY
jgi:hypothetical protein